MARELSGHSLLRSRNEYRWNCRISRGNCSSVVRTFYSARIARTVDSQEAAARGAKIMPIAHLTLEVNIDSAQSLKDRRQVVRSLKDKLRTSFNVSVAELDGAELWNRATLGVVSISNSKDYLRGLMENVERAATKIANNAGAEITDSFIEYL